MDMQATGSTFPPHPGTVIFRTQWNHTHHIEQAAGIPEANKFVYYDASGSETSDLARAVKRVPVVEVEMSSFDADGNLVEPAKATRVSIDEFGPGHQFLRHSGGPGGMH